MIVIVILLAAMLFALSAAHLAWALGSPRPARDERELARTVAGFRGIESMPPRAAPAAVAVLLGLTGLLVLALSDANERSIATTGIVAAMVFLARGAICFTQSWRRRTPEEPFATLDRRYYSPLCPLIGAGFLALGIARLA